MNRELATTIIRGNGDRHDVFILTVGDILDIDFSEPDFIYRLAAKSMDIPFDEFKLWGTTDALRVLDVVGKTLQM